MGRQRKERKPGEDVRYTMVVPHDLDATLEAVRVAKQRQLPANVSYTMTDLVREILTTAGEQMSGGGGGSGEISGPSSLQFAPVVGVREAGSVLLRLTPEQQAAAARLGSLRGLDAAGACATVLGRHLGPELAAEVAAAEALAKLAAAGNDPGAAATFLEATAKHATRQPRTAK